MDQEGKKLYKREWHKRNYAGVKVLRTSLETLSKELEDQKQKYNKLHAEFTRYKAENKEKIITMLRDTRDFYIYSWGGDYNNMPDVDRANCDEIDEIILNIMNFGSV